MQNTMAQRAHPRNECEQDIRYKRFAPAISCWHLDCSMHQGSWLEYDAIALEERSEARSKLNQVTGKCYVYHMLLVQRTSSRICLGTPDTANDSQTFALAL